ncbi:uncharacterized protein BP01DRAFT_352828 [Aspergillus saccharolyticus JOP 1030-1]|uniref:Uncharacterized protein n=1 Tax=Aspergillus saccharolyticus JOP 1030-1 TaxID=1450539 RepID=A0A318ZNY1_9EURO|nr:hypothetical protein BP01DRAFT_352828 [Aspergillus saccharolyticus JOP 1030-1]PYH49331.1 hypothetical protein BP01DRAFT_352828 [Aspergillus saccharolyticus JOP 1030-1]
MGADHESFSGGRNNRGIYTICALIAGGLIIHRYYSSSPADKDALPFPYGDHKDPEKKKIVKHP